MAQTNTLGPVGYNPTGEYDNTHEYERLDVVYYEGSSYVALKDSIGQINITKDTYVQGGTITPELSNTVSHLTISVDTSEDLPILQIIPPEPTNANYSYNYAYMLEIIGGAYTEIYKTTRN